MKSKTIIMLIFPLGLLVFFNGVSRLAIKETRKEIALNYSLSVNPLPPDLIKIFAGEFKGLAADYLLLELGSFMGSNQAIGSKNWEKIALAFEQTLQLDPYFQQTYVYVQGLLAWDGDMHEKAISLLDISRRHRPWDWRPGYYMGFDYYYFLKDYSKASEIFLDTAKIKGAPVLLAALGGRFAMKSGRTEAAIVLLKSMLEDPELDKEGEREISDRIAALRGVLLLENAIKKYKSRHNIYPPSLETLSEQGFIRQLPKNPYSDRYYYDKEGGQVFFDETR
jgi:tetratricopeptide (TPR) repeat protein